MSNNLSHSRFLQPSSVPVPRRGPLVWNEPSSTNTGIEQTKLLVSPGRCGANCEFLASVEKNAIGFPRCNLSEFLDERKFPEVVRQEEGFGEEGDRDAEHF